MNPPNVKSRKGVRLKTLTLANDLLPAFHPFGGKGDEIRTTERASGIPRISNIQRRVAANPIDMNKLLRTNGNTTPPE
jgi:hypothetical protein